MEEAEIDGRNQRPSKKSAIETTSDNKDLDTALKFGEIDDRIKQAQKHYQEEQHKRRLEFIKQQLENSRKDNWRYPDIGRLLGYSNE
uniref:Uncharacterized protein n=1 Tax=Acrobeloides nanus TaxID=290746 RepID=A0A914DM30_9BILA